MLDNWKSYDMDPNRMILPSEPYLFLDEVNNISEKSIHYTCRPYKNELLKKIGHIPIGIIIEFFQGYMVLIDWMGYSKIPKNVDRRAHRALGGNVEYLNEMPNINDDIFIDIEIQKVSNVGKVTIVEYNGCLSSNSKQILKIINNKGISSQINEKNITTKPLDLYFGENIIKNYIFDSVIAKNNTMSLYNHSYLISKIQINSNSWFFDCHFVNDPCMPGTLLMQYMFDMIGAYINNDNIKPIYGNMISYSAKNNILPKNKEIIVKIEISKETNTELFFDCIIFVDSVLSFHINNVGVQK